MSNELKDWLEDVRGYQKAVREDFEKDYEDTSDNSFIEYLLMRMYYANVPAVNKEVS